MKAPYMPLYVKDWLLSRKILAMPGPCVKAYLYLLCEAWRQEPRATLPNNDSELCDMARCGQPEWLLIKPVIMERFYEGENNRLCAKFAFEMSCKMLTNQRPNNKNANRTRNKRAKNAPLGNGNGNGNALGNGNAFSNYNLKTIKMMNGKEVERPIIRGKASVPETTINNPKELELAANSARMVFDEIRNKHKQEVVRVNELPF